MPLKNATSALDMMKLLDIADNELPFNAAEETEGSMAMSGNLAALVVAVGDFTSVQLELSGASFEITADDSTATREVVTFRRTTSRSQSRRMQKKKDREAAAAAAVAAAAARDSSRDSSGGEKAEGGTALMEVRAIEEDQALRAGAVGGGEPIFDCFGFMCIPRR